MPRAEFFSYQELRAVAMVANRDASLSPHCGTPSQHSGSIHEGGRSEPHGPEREMVDRVTLWSESNGEVRFLRLLPGVPYEVMAVTRERLANRDVRGSDMTQSMHR